MKNQVPQIYDSFSAEKIANNIYLLTDILLRIPAISLIRFKFVSKQWLNLISDPKFCLSHTKLHLNPDSKTPFALLLKNPVDSTHQLVPVKNYALPSKLPSFDYLNNGAEIEIEQSCNGLLLCSCKIQYDITSRADVEAIMEDNSCLVFPGYNVKVFFVCNPITKEFKKVYFPAEFGYSGMGVYLAFDPSKSLHYKLIYLFSIPQRRGYDFGINLYSSETDSWRFLQVNMHIFRDFFPCLNVIYYNGSIHWPPTRKFGTCWYFDIETESFKQMPTPPSYVGGEVLKYFGESGGRLLLVVKYSSEPKLEFDVLEMALDYSEWSVTYHVNLDSVKMEFPQLAWDGKGGGYSILSIICAEKGQENPIAVLAVGDVILAYNISRGTSKIVCDVRQFGKLGDSNKEFKIRWTNTFSYFDTLFHL